MVARVIEILADKYKVSVNDVEQPVFAKSRGKVKRDKIIKVGDIVELSKVLDEYIIESVKERKNDYIRPQVANMDYMYIVIAAGSPKPDFLLLDKQIITAESNNCKPIIVVNKMDLINSEEVLEYIKKVYSSVGYKLIYTSTIDKELLNESSFKDLPSGSLCAFSGNSGVGKSSIVSKLISDDFKLTTNTLSRKTGKGRHTTKSSTVYTLLNNKGENIYILDTPGFSSYEIYNISSKKLKDYYNEFSGYKCEFDDCKHINEDIKCCKVKQALNDKKIDQTRYNNYVMIYEEIVKKEKRLYK